MSGSSDVSWVSGDGWKTKKGSQEDEHIYKLNLLKIENIVKYLNAFFEEGRGGKIKFHQHQHFPSKEASQKGRRHLISF